MLATNSYMMAASLREKTNYWEWVGLRAGMTIYSGWVTAATILNATFMLKRFGVADPNISFLNEEQWTVIILYIALVIYNLAASIEINPLFGSVFIWVITAIIANIKEKGGNAFALEHAGYIQVAQSVLMVGFWSFYGTVTAYGVDTGLERGLMY